MNESSRNVEKERRLEMELDEWKNKNGILEESMKTSDNENEILKSEVDQLKVQLQELRNKQASAQEMEELSLMQAKKEMEVLRTETKEKLQQSEQLEQERRWQDLENLKQAQTEIESYKRDLSRNRGKSEMFSS